jgi:hypothetical protein
VKRYLKFVGLSVAAAFIYTEAWLLPYSSVLVWTDGVWSLPELCSGIAALGIAWCVRRYVKLWPLALCSFAGALPVLYVWLFARTNPMWDLMTGYLRWGLLRPFVISAAMLPVAFLVLRLWPSNNVLQDDAPKARV